MFSHTLILAESSCDSAIPITITPQPSTLPWTSSSRLYDVYEFTWLIESVTCVGALLGEDVGLSRTTTLKRYAGPMLHLNHEEDIPYPPCV
eukprot:50745-Eustigmatos_ZCMA.PRE.1